MFDFNFNDFGCAGRQDAHVLTVLGKAKIGAYFRAFMTNTHVNQACVGTISFNHQVLRNALAGQAGEVIAHTVALARALLCWVVVHKHRRCATDRHDAKRLSVNRLHSNFAGDICLVIKRIDEWFTTLRAISASTQLNSANGISHFRFDAQFHQSGYAVKHQYHLRRLFAGRAAGSHGEWNLQCAASGNFLTEHIDGGACATGRTANALHWTIKRIQKRCLKLHIGLWRNESSVK